MATPRLIHCSYHKCLTVYYRRVMHAVFNVCLPWSRGYRHFNSHLADFYDGFADHRVASVNNRALDLERLGDFRLSRFLRDPRDLVVSGYFYHRRGAETWVEIEGPTEEDWYFANARIPEGLKTRGGSLSSYLQEISKEEGLLAEIELRGPHFESMSLWPEEDSRVLTLRYEELMADPVGSFERLFDHYGLSGPEAWLARRFARRYALAPRKADTQVRDPHVRDPHVRDPHVRDPRPGQWREHFTERVRREFDLRHGALIESLGYPVD